MSEILHPVYIEWEVTPSCNFNCVHCYNYWRGGQEEAKSSNNIEYLRIAQAIIDSKPVHVTITGGEPLLVFDQIKKSILALLDHGIFVSMNTNLSLLSDEMIIFFQEIKIPLFVSIPSSDPEVCDKITGVKGSLSLISNNIKLALNAGIDIFTNMVVSKINQHTLFETAKYVVTELGIPYFCATKASFPANANKNFKESLLNIEDLNWMLHSLTIIKNTYGIDVDTAWAYSFCGFETNNIIENFAFKRKCSAGKLSFSINSVGDVFACPSDNMSYGNLLNASFAEIIPKMNSWQNDSMKPDECIECNLYDFCGGGCRMDALHSKGNATYLDTNANCNNIGKSMPFPQPNKDVLDEIIQKRMKYNNKVRWVAEERCIRLSLEKNYTFVSKDFFEFIRTAPSFSVQEITKKESDYNMIVYALYHLKNLGILFYSEEVTS